MKKKLKKFATSIERINYLKEETVFFAIQGDTERYIQKKFALHLFKENQGKKSECIISLEGYKLTDMIMNESQKLHFVEWKGMTISINTEGYQAFNMKLYDNYRQLLISYIRFKNDANINNKKGHFWSAFVIVEFNKGFIKKYNEPEKGKLERFGVFEKYGKALWANPKLSFKRNFKSDFWIKRQLSEVAHSRRHVKIRLGIVDLTEKLEKLYSEISQTEPLVIQLGGSEINLKIKKEWAANKNIWGKYFENSIDYFS